MSDTNMTIESLMMSNFLNFMVSKISVPEGFHSQVNSIKTMLGDDVSGLVDSLSDFMINSASVDYTIETKNDNLTATLKNWLEKLNLGYNGMVPVGVSALAREYFNERWKYSSFPVLRLAKWEKFDGLLLPTKLFFLDGASIHAYDKDKVEDIPLLNYDYYLGEKNKSESNKLEKNIIFSKPFCRWFDKYPIPFLIKRGIYHNYKIIESVKQQEERTLSRVIPYLLHITKGGEFKDRVKTYSDPQLQEIADQFKTITKEIKKNNGSVIRASNFDEEIKHLVPDLTDLFKPELFENAEKNILGGFGYINLANISATTGKSAQLNPQAFMEEVKAGVAGFKSVMNQVMYRIQDTNKNEHNKYMNDKFNITSSPIKGFMTDAFKSLVRLMYDRGRISSQTAVELVCEVDFQTEVIRREREDKNGVQKKMYPVITQNQEQHAYQKDELDTLDRVIPDDKIDETQKKEYNNAVVKVKDGAYKKLEDLPAQIRSHATEEVQSIWMLAFNEAYETYEGDTESFKIAWRAVKEKAKKNEDGNWIIARDNTNKDLNSNIGGENAG